MVKPSMSGNRKWGLCPVCQKDRRTKTSGEMFPHNKATVEGAKPGPVRTTMVPCEGSFQIAQSDTTLYKKVGNK